MDKQTPNQELIHREMYRRSQDDVMVGNPTDKDFFIEWDGYRFEVPAATKDLGWGQGKREVKRYLAEWYCRHMKDELINQMGEEKTADLLSGRPKGEGFVTKWHENEWLKPQIPRTDDKKLIEEIYPSLFLGVTREFGNDQPQVEFVNPDGRTQDEKIMEEISNKKYMAEVIPPPAEDLFPDIKEVTVKTEEKPPIYISKAEQARLDVLKETNA